MAELPLPTREIHDLCRKHGVERLEVFGSVLTPGFGAESDVDFLVEFSKGAEKPWAAHYQALESDLAAPWVARLILSAGQLWSRVATGFGVNPSSIAPCPSMQRDLDWVVESVFVCRNSNEGMIG